MMKIATAFLGSCLAAVVSLPLHITAARAEPLRLRVLTFNVWGVPVLTPARSQRVDAIADAISRVGPDLVAFEEVWVGDDAERLAARLRPAGLRFHRRFSSAIIDGSGLLVVSRRPIVDAKFQAYRHGGYTDELLHAEWMVDKGIARVAIETEVGPVDFALTHLQASYDGDKYLFVQISQALEAASVLEANRRHPLIFAGDVNASVADLPFRWLLARADLATTDPRSGIDTILVRNGERVAIRTLSVENLFTEETRLADGSRRRLSDHPAVLATLELDFCEECDVPATSIDTVRNLVRETTARLAPRVALTRFGIERAAFAPLAFFGCVLAHVALRRRLRSLGSRLSWKVALALAFVALGWIAYVDLRIAPANARELEELASELRVIDASHATRASLQSMK